MEDCVCLAQIDKTTKRDKSCVFEFQRVRTMSDLKDLSNSAAKTDAK